MQLSLLIYYATRSFRATTSFSEGCLYCTRQVETFRHSAELGLEGDGGLVPLELLAKVGLTDSEGLAEETRTAMLMRPERAASFTGAGKSAVPW